jgi:hypothetical protein
MVLAEQRTLRVPQVPRFWAPGIEYVIFATSLHPNPSIPFVPAALYP